jgi:hypothetical protein
MMHLTAISIAPRYALVAARFGIAVRFGIAAGLRCARTPPFMSWADSALFANVVRVIFRSRAVNSLEMPNAAFHYSVIGGNVPTLLARGEIDRRLLNDEVSASGPEMLVLMLTQCGYCPCSSTAGDERRLNLDCAGRVFEPGEERLMQMTVILFREYKSTSRSRISE